MFITYHLTPYCCYPCIICHSKTKYSHSLPFPLLKRNVRTPSSLTSFLDIHRSMNLDEVPLACPSLSIVCIYNGEGNTARRTHPIHDSRALISSQSDL